MATALVVKIVGVVLTLFVFSRIVWAENNPLFRLAQYLFIGVSLGYAFVVLYHQVLWPAVVQVVLGTENPQSLDLYLTLVPFILGLLLLPRITGRQGFSWLANIPLALLFGVGAALAVGGVLVGTLYPQWIDTVQPAGNTLPQLIGAAVLAVGVILTLSYFYFTVRRDTGLGRLVAGSAHVGYWLLMVALGFFLAGALRTYLAALSERLEFLVTWTF
jgi:hypothetical protein